MFKRSYRGSEGRVGKPIKVSKRSFGDDCKRQLVDKFQAHMSVSPMTSPSIAESSPKLNEEFIALVVGVGKDQRILAAHENALRRATWFSQEISKEFGSKDFFSPPNRRAIHLPDDDPLVVSAVIEFLYKGDYSPNLVFDKKRGRFYLEGVSTARNGPTTPQRSDATVTHSMAEKKFVGFNDIATIFHTGVGDYILRDTAVYCAAHRFGLPKLQRLALQKQGLQTGIDVGTILRSARFAYANTPESESKLRAHYLTLIIRNRKTFKQSGTMQKEMEKGGTQLFFDLFVALCNHIDDSAVTAVSA